MIRVWCLNQECVPCDQRWLVTKVNSLSWSCMFWHVDKICLKSISLWSVPVITKQILSWSNGLHCDYQGHIKTHKQPIWWMVVNEGVFLIEDTCFHDLEIIKCFIKFMCHRWILRWVHSSIQVSKVPWLMDTSHVDQCFNQHFYYHLE